MNKKMNKDMVIEKKWCGHWNMSIAADKTEVMIFTYDGKIPEEQSRMKYDGELLKVTVQKGARNSFRQQPEFQRTCERKN